MQILYIVQSEFRGNVAGLLGGGIYLEYGNTETFVLRNTLFANNTARASGGGGLFSRNDIAPLEISCVFTGNLALYGSDYATPPAMFLPSNETAVVLPTSGPMLVSFLIADATGQRVLFYPKPVQYYVSTTAGCVAASIVAEHQGRLWVRVSATGAPDTAVRLRVGATAKDGNFASSSWNATIGRCQVGELQPASPDLGICRTCQHCPNGACGSICLLGLFRLTPCPSHRSVFAG
jgi:hypothetical protein